MHGWKRFFILLLACALAACEGGEGNEGGTVSASATASAGVHFQDEDCMFCHNRDLASNRWLTMAATVYTVAQPTDAKNLAQLCGGELSIQLLDQSANVVFDSKNKQLRDVNSTGLKGKGNVYFLYRKIQAIQGDYFVRMVAENGVTLSQSLTLHGFGRGAFDETQTTPTADLANRYDCNQCHRLQPQQGAPGVLYAKQGVSACL